VNDDTVECFENVMAQTDPSSGQNRCHAFVGFMLNVPVGSRQGQSVNSIFFCFIPFHYTILLLAAAGAEISPLSADSLSSTLRRFSAFWLSDKLFSLEPASSLSLRFRFKGESLSVVDTVLDDCVAVVVVAAVAVVAIAAAVVVTVESSFVSLSLSLIGGLSSRSKYR
jgi:hypothetical protein